MRTTRRTLRAYGSLLISFSGLLLGPELSSPHLRAQVAGPLTPIPPALPPATADGVDADPASPQQLAMLRQSAREQFEQRQWEAAFPLYVELARLERSNPENRERMHRCLRHLMQARRLRDPRLHGAIASLSAVQAGALYEEVLEKLQAIHVERGRAQTQSLFQAGLEEFQLALEDAEVRQRLLADVPERQLEEYRRRLREVWSDRTFQTLKDARLAVATIARGATQQLGLKFQFVVLEFICGACHSLDEYTAYLTPAELEEGPASNAPGSVRDVALLKDGVGYLRIAEFRDSTPEELDAALNTLRGGGEGNPLRALILDLRGNEGGQFQAAVRVAERFLNHGVIATTLGQLGEANKIFTPTPGAPVLDLPLVVLVDGRTASAAEVLGHALLENHRATVVGMPTFGKGSIQKVFPLVTAQERPEKGDTGKPRPRTGGVRITLARILTPGGRPLANGLTPHFLASSPDAQLAIALREAGGTMMPVPMPMPMPMRP